jgi:hypothetical protein
MARFKRGEIDVLIATTVIEVGVDVPNATVMVIEHAERFGLAQMHQLRGRVGRGAAKSYCILMTGGQGERAGGGAAGCDGATQNGFELAELDLQQRGPGEFFGTRQAGLPEFRVANLIRDRASAGAGEGGGGAVRACRPEHAASGSTRRRIPPCCGDRSVRPGRRRLSRWQSRSPGRGRLRRRCVHPRQRPSRPWGGVSGRGPGRSAIRSRSITSRARRLPAPVRRED